MANEKGYPILTWLDDVPGIQAGTPQNQTNLNNIECGIFSSSIVAAFLTLNARETDRQMLETETISILATINGSNTDFSVVIPTSKTRNRTTYNVTAEINAITGTAATAGDIIITAKQINGFKIKYNGTATAVTLRLQVRGGII